MTETVERIAANGKPSAKKASRADHVDLNTLLAEPKDAGLFTTSKGVVLRLKKIAVMPMQRAMEGLEQPEPPMWFNPDTDRSEPNPLDPGYVKALRRYQTEVMELTSRVTLGRGTEVESLPEGFDPVDGQTWAEELAFISNDRMTIPDHGIARYVAWLRWYVLSDKDIIDVVRAVQVYNGWVQEVDVDKAAADFRDTGERGANTESVAS